jgi:hypothetical protein
VALTEKFQIAYDDIPSLVCILAGVAYLLKVKTLTKTEKLILLILSLNISVDVAADIISKRSGNTHILYNFLLPVERMLTLVVYYKSESFIEKKRLQLSGVLIILIVFVIGYFRADSLRQLHSYSNIISAILTAILSYVHLRSIMLNQAGQSKVVFFFALANVLYFTLMPSAMSAFPLAFQISNSLAASMLHINLVAYTVWAILLIIGLPWKKRVI